MFKIVG